MSICYDVYVMMLAHMLYVMMLALHVLDEHMSNTLSSEWSFVRARSLEVLKGVY